MAVHGVEREHATAHIESCDQGLRCGDFVRFLVDDFVPEDNLVIDGEGAEDMRGLAVGESIEALPQRFAVYGDEARRPGGRRPRATGFVEVLRMAAKGLLQIVWIDLLQDTPHRCVGGSAPQRRCGESRVEKLQPIVDRKSVV